MRVDPAIAALRRDRTPQRRAQAAMVAACDVWRASPVGEPALADLERYGAGAPLSDCLALGGLFTRGGSASAFAAAFAKAFCLALEREPFGHPPLRHGFDRGISTLLLARSGRARLVLLAREPGCHSFGSVALQDAVRFEAVLGGSARGRVMRRIRARSGFAERPMALRRGARLALDLSRVALQVIEVERRLVSLRLDRSASRPGPVREYALVDGALLHQSASGIRASRHEAMLALLGRMGRADSVRVMAEIAAEPGVDSLRWQALRECLGLDTAAGFRALCALAAAPGDPLAGPAGALRTQLVEAHPSLRALEAQPCRA